MSSLKPMDLAFFAMENQNRPMHMAAFQLFELPKNASGKFISRIVQAYRDGAVGPPFNQKIKWLSEGVARWEQVEADLSYHIRHIAVPGPGSMEQLYEIVSFLNTPLLDRAYPLWEIYVIEGIEHNRFAVMVRVHHAMLDGASAIRQLRQSLSTSVRDRKIRSPCDTLDEPGDTPRKPAGQSASNRDTRKLLSQLNKLPGGMRDLTGGLMGMGAQALGIRKSGMTMPFGATRASFNNTAVSSARRYANCELSFPLIKAVARANKATVNDVVMTAIDAALHRYLVEQGDRFEERLVALMAMSLRERGDPEAAGNQVSAVLVPMGESDCSVQDRLEQLKAATTQAKEESRKLSPALLQTYSLVIAGGAALSELYPPLSKLPHANVLISNMPGPREQLYLCGARLVGLHGLPIVPPGAGVNVTFLSLGDTICLGVGSVPEAVANPFRLTQLIEENLQQLAKKLPKEKPKRKTQARKK
jgi:WS/DGAT/MGAT family acyltransferase